MALVLALAPLKRAWLRLLCTLPPGFVYIHLSSRLGTASSQPFLTGDAPSPSSPWWPFIGLMSLLFFYNKFTSVLWNFCYLAAIVLIINLNCLFMQLLVGGETKEPQNKAKEKTKKRSIWKYCLSRTSYTKRPYSWQFCAAQRLIIFKTWHFPAESHATLRKFFSISGPVLLFKEKGILGFGCFCHVKGLKRLTAVGSAASRSCTKHALLGETGNLSVFESFILWCPSTEFSCTEI